MSTAAVRGGIRHRSIDGFYKLEIEPWLKKREQLRIAAIRRRWLLIGGGIVAAAAIAAYVWTTPGMHEAWYLLAGAVVFASVVLGLYTTASLRREVKAFLTAKLAAFYGFSYEAEPNVDPVPRFRELGLVPSHDRCRIEDRWWGSADGVAFELVEAHLEDKQSSTNSKGKTSTKYLTVFRGPLLTFPCPHAGDTPVVLRRDLGRLANWIRAKFVTGTPVKVDDPEFEKAFEVFAADAAAATRLLDPATRKRLLGLAAGRSITIAFHNREVLLAIESINLFELESFGHTLLDPERIRQMAQELGIVFEIIERLELKPAADDGASVSS